jgi:Rod binding domain-containing protein
MHALTAIDTTTLRMAASAPAPAPAVPQSVQARARAQAQDFEAVFLNSMFQQMYAGLDGDGPFGGSAGVGVWRSFLTDQYAKSMVQAGGIGIADHVYRTLLSQQEAAAR